LRGKCEGYIYKSSITKSASNNTRGHERNFSMIKGAQKKLRSMKKNPKDPKDLSFPQN
jgi:hypothetical protein